MIDPTIAKWMEELYGQLDMAYDDVEAEFSRELEIIHENGSRTLKFEIVDVRYEDDKIKVKLEELP